jgi:TRAP-type C4-dicarboxylate transport system permease small subunit
LIQAKIASNICPFDAAAYHAKPAVQASPKIDYLFLAITLSARRVTNRLKEKRLRRITSKAPKIGQGKRTKELCGMQRVVAVWDRLNSLIKFVEKWMLIVLFVSMLFCGALQILARFVFHAPIAWSEEMLTYSFVWASFLGASLAVDLLAHFNVDIFIHHFPPKLAKAVLYLVWLIMLWFTAFLVYKGTILTKLNVVQTMDVLPLSMAWAYASIPVSAVFMFIHTMDKLLTGSFLPACEEGE